MQVILSILYIIISITTLIVLYRAFLKYRESRKGPQPKFCELISLEHQPVSAEVDFCFICDDAKTLEFDICDLKFNSIVSVASGDFKEGQHIIPFDTTTIEDGEYFYRLKTDNQQIFKKIEIRNTKSENLS